MARRGSAAVCVCVPVRNERQRLPQLLRALAQQQNIDHLSLSLCIFFDSCDDGSEGVVRDLAGALPYPMATLAKRSSTTPNAGRARRSALRLGLSVLEDKAGGALLTTDADTAPASDWIAEALQALGGADVVTGRIERLGHRDQVQDGLELYLDKLHAYRRRLDPVPWEAPLPHHFTGGANMGFQAHAYRTIGGFRPQANGEDALIIDQAHRAGLKVRRDPRMRVRTSARRIGRASAGLAAHLKDLRNRGAEDIRVMHPEDAGWQYEGHAQARYAFESRSPAAVAALAQRLDASTDAMKRLMAEAPNAEAFAMRLVPVAPCARMIPLTEAQAVLARLQTAAAVAA